MASGLFGWDLLYSGLKDDIKNNQDILVCLTHLVLVSNGFKCIGLGESKNFDGTEPKSESLPKGWNDDYAIRYVYQGRLYNLKATNLDDGVMINLVRVDERTVGLVQLNVRSVAERTGTLEEMIPDNKNIIDSIKQQLIDKVVISEKQKDSSCQTDPQPGTATGTRTPPSSSSHPELRDQRLPSRDLFQIDPAYGRSDLDPFGGLGYPPRIIRPPGSGGGGGMLFQPPHPAFPGGGNIGIPPGSLPPGARFDPFRPPEGFPPARRPPNRPDNDEFPPPDYDNMFM